MTIPRYMAANTMVLYAMELKKTDYFATPISNINIHTHLFQIEYKTTDNI